MVILTYNNTLKKDTASVEFMEIIESFNLKRSLYKPTRPISGTCIDNFYHNVRASLYALWLDIILLNTGTITNVTTASKIW